MNKKNESALFDQLLGTSNSIDVRRLLKALWSRWYWILLALFLAGLLCFFYLKLATPQYVISVQLKYSGRQSELEDLTSSRTTFVFNSATNDYLTEKYNVRSQQVVQHALVKLNNPFTFYRVKDFRKIDPYPYRPLDLEVIRFEPGKYGYGKFTLDENLDLQYTTKHETKLLKLSQHALISVPGLVLKVKAINTAAGFNYEFVYNDPTVLANSFIGDIDVEEEEEQMPVLALAFKNHNPVYCKDFFAKLLEAYQEYDLSQKQKSTDLTINFIDEQVGIFSDSLKAAARDLETFKLRNQVIDVSSSANEIATKLREFEQEKHELRIKKEFVALLENALGKSFETVNYLSVGLDGSTDGVLVGLLERFNELISKRKEAGLKYSANAPAVRNMDEELNKFRSQIYDNITLQKKKNDGAIEILDENIGRLKKRFNQIPGLEKNFLYLQSNFEINKNIHSLLLNKKIESSIIRAGMLPSFVVISKPDVDKVSPKNSQIILLSLVGGLLLGVLSVLGARYLNLKFTNISNIGNHTRVSLVGIVQHFPEKLTNSAKDMNKLLSDRTVFTESLSALRTRLSFSGKFSRENLEERGRVIVITSDKSGEGKSFITLNLGISFTKIGKKVLIVGADLRKSKLHYFFDHNNKIGLSSYLQGTQTDLKTLVHISDVVGLDYIPAGPVPFNPGELLQKSEFQALLDEFGKRYDYIILDTAPVGLVADAVPFLSKADHVLFIIRWLYSDKDAQAVPEALADEYDIQQIMVVVNDFYPDDLHNSLVAGSDSGYGSYGYRGGTRDSSYYTAAKPGLKQWFKKLFSKRG